MNSKTRFSKRIVSMLLTLAMVFSVIGTVNVFAVDTGESSTKRGKVGIDYLGNGATPAATAQAMPDPSTLISGKYLWVGLYLSDLKNMEDSNDEVVVSNANVAGYFNITSSIEFASKYLNYVTTTTSKQMDYLNATNVWKDEYVTNQGDVDSYGDPPIMAKKGEAYTATVANRTTVSSTGREPAVIKDEDTPNSVTVQLMANDDAPKTARIFADGSKNDKIYIAIVGFRIKTTATADNPIPGGTKLVTAGLNAADFTASTGTASETLFTAAWHTDRSNTSAGNLKNFLDYQGDPNFVPAGVVSVPVKTNVDGTVTDTGNTISSKDTAYKFADIKAKLGANPTKAGHTFAGWSLTSGGTVLTDSSDVTVSADMKDAGITFYAVFTKNKVNYTAADFTVSGNTATYSGSAVTAPSVVASASATGTVGAISNIKVGTTAANASTTMPTNAGTYKIFVDVAGTDDYNAATALEVGTYTVNKKDATITLTAPTNSTFGETDAGKVNVAVTGAADLAAMGKVVKYAKKGTTAYSETVPTAAGEYTATISNSNATLANNFNVTGTQTLDFTIAAKAVTVDLTATTVTYGDTVTITPTFNVTPAPAHKVEYKVNGSYTTTAPKNAGSYDVKVTITDTNYSGSKEVTNGLVINKKALTIPNTITIPAAKEGATGADLVKNATYTFKAADGIVGSDVVTVAYTVTYTAPVVKDTTPDVALTKGDVTGAAKDNYEVGAMPTGVKGSVTNLSSATWKDTVAPTKTVKASDTTVNDKTYIETGVLADTTFLPATAKVMVDGAEKSVGLTWEVKSVTYNAKGGTYTYEATVTESTEFDVSGLAKPTATITVEAVNITPVTVQPISAKLGDTAPTLPTSGTTTGDVAVPYRIDWVDGSGNPVTELKTDAVLTATYTGTVTYDLTGKEWATEPTDKSVTLSYTVSDKDKTVINSVDDNADVNVKASDEKNTAEDIASLLPATVKAKDAAGNDVELAVTWATTDTFNAKGGEYTYTATFTDEVLADYDVSAITEPVTVKIVVAPVTVKFNKTFKDLSVKKGADNTSFETLGVAAGALSGTIKADDGTDVPYTISWSPDSTELDTSKSGNKQEFTGIVTLTAPDWMTVETIEPVKMTIKVRTSGGGGGGTAAYTVTFSAGKNGTMEGKSSVSVNAGSKVAATAVPEIKAMDGYKFVGWSIDGETTVDPTSATVSKAVKYTALYEEVTAPTPTPTQKPSIDTKYTKPYASGYEDGTFRPNNNITRCELAAMIARLINGDDIADGSYVSSFPDVAADAWANKYIGFLEDKGILSGYEDGTFRPYNTITRGEMCAVIARAQKYDIISVDDMFTDVTDADWAKDYITTLASMNIVSGYDGTLFGTYSPLTRAETVAIINRVLDPSTAIVTFTPNDIAGHWAEADIILAVNERQVNGSEPEVTPEPETTPEPEATKAPEATDDPEATKAPEATETPEA